MSTEPVAYSPHCTWYDDVNNAERMRLGKDVMGYACPFCHKPALLGLNEDEWLTSLEDQIDKRFNDRPFAQAWRRFAAWGKGRRCYNDFAKARAAYFKEHPEELLTSFGKMVQR